MQHMAQLTRTVIDGCVAHEGSIIRFLNLDPWDSFRPITILRYRVTAYTVSIPHHVVYMRTAAGAEIQSKAEAEAEVAVAAGS